MPKTNLVPIKVTLPLRPNGHLDWPAFNRLDSSVRQDMEWSRFIDSKGIRWHYDKQTNIGQGNSDVDTACTLISKEFADAAVAMFPNQVSIINEEEWEDFYDNKAHAHEPEEFIDTEVLQGIVARVDLESKGVAPRPSQSIRDRRQQALDPNNTIVSGIRKNEHKTWALLKQKTGYTIHSDYAKPGP